MKNRYQKLSSATLSVSSVSAVFLLATKLCKSSIQIVFCSVSSVAANVSALFCLGTPNG